MSNKYYPYDELEELFLSACDISDWRCPIVASVDSDKVSDYQYAIEWFTG